MITKKSFESEQKAIDYLNELIPNGNKTSLNTFHMYYRFLYLRKTVKKNGSMYECGFDVTGPYHGPYCTIFILNDITIASIDDFILATFDDFLNGRIAMLRDIMTEYHMCLQSQGGRPTFRSRGFKNDVHLHHELLSFCNVQKYNNENELAYLRSQLMEKDAMIANVTKQRTECFETIYKLKRELEEANALNTRLKNEITRIKHVPSKRALSDDPFEKFIESPLYAFNTNPGPTIGFVLFHFIVNEKRSHMIDENTKKHISLQNYCRRVLGVGDLLVDEQRLNDVQVACLINHHLYPDGNVPIESDIITPKRQCVEQQHEKEDIVYSTQYGDGEMEHFSFDSSNIFSFPFED